MRSGKTPTRAVDRLPQSGGAYTSIRDLIRLRHAAREISAIAATRSRNPLSGLLTSSFRGRGIDFSEVRVYQPGDDIRTIDWRVTARTQVAHTKVFQEEKERPVLILVDQSQSMFFGSQVAFKSVIAAQAAALLAWTALDRGDRTGGIVFSERGHRDVRPRRSKHAVLRLLSELTDFNLALKRENPAPSANGHYLAEALRNVRRVAKHGSTIFLVSDFLGFDESALIHFNQLARHNDIVGFFVADPLERQLPKPDLYTITNGVERVRINTGDRHYRSQFADQFLARLTQTRDAFARIKAPLLELSTDTPVVSSVVNQYNAYVAAVK